MKTFNDDEIPNLGKTRTPSRSFSTTVQAAVDKYNGKNIIDRIILKSDPKAEIFSIEVKPEHMPDPRILDLIAHIEVQNNLLRQILAK